jgi:alpha-galactosidase
VDDGWSDGRDASGNLVADPTQFPGGMAPLSTYVRAAGYGWGMYTDRGTAQCGAKPNTGSQGHEAGDAAWFVALNVTYLKEDSVRGRGARAQVGDRIRRGEVPRAGRAGTPGLGPS